MFLHILFAPFLSHSNPTDLFRRRSLELDIISLTESPENR